MCRISGILSFKGKAQSFVKTGQKMRDVLAYGGPDDAGEYVTDHVYLGHRRLAIIDLSPGGHQPMVFKSWAIVFNGEIYNHEEIASELKTLGYQFTSHSDTEVILKAFDCWGYKSVEKFRGMFAFALWNSDTQKLLLCRDRVGVKPLYWSKQNDVFLFASELKALRQWPGFNAEIDHAAVSLFLQNGYIPSPGCIYKNTTKLMPGHFLEADLAGNVNIWPYWSADAVAINNEFTNEQAVLNQTEQIITESCRLRMVADVPVGVFLSGGIDSSLVTAILQKDAVRKIKTFTIGFKDKGYDESSYAKTVASHLGTEHAEYLCTEADFLAVVNELPDMYDEPFGDSSGIPTHLVAKMAREQVTVALSADGGDEVFAGYDRYRIANSFYGKIKYLPLGLRKIMAAMALKTDPKTIGDLSKILPFKVDVRSLEWRLPKIANTLSANSPLDFYAKSVGVVPVQLVNKLHKVPAEPLFNRSGADNANGFYAGLGKLDIKTYLEGDILTKVDRATMQVALEGREPLLDHKLIEFGLSLPDHLKVRNGQGKWIMRQLLYKYVPQEMVDRPKQGFAVPIKAWLQNNLKADIERMQHDKAFAELFRLDRDTLREVVNSFYTPGKAAVNPYFIWNLYSLYQWYLRWMN